MPAATVTNNSFELDPGVDAGQLAPIFARTGRLHIPGVLAPAARYPTTGWTR